LPSNAGLEWRLFGPVGDPLFGGKELARWGASAGLRGRLASCWESEGGKTFLGSQGEGRKFISCRFRGRTAEQKKKKQQAPEGRPIARKPAASRMMFLVGSRGGGKIAQGMRPVGSAVDQRGGIDQLGRKRVRVDERRLRPGTSLRTGDRQGGRFTPTQVRLFYWGGWLPKTRMWVGSGDVTKNICRNGGFPGARR